MKHSHQFQWRQPQRANRLRYLCSVFRAELGITYCLPIDKQMLSKFSRVTHVKLQYTSISPTIFVKIITPSSQKGLYRKRLS